MGTTPPRLTLATPEVESTSKIPAVITERYLADLTRRLYRARHQRARYVEEWDHIVQTAYELQTILDAQASKKLVFNRNQPHSVSGVKRFATLTPTLRYHLHTHLLPAFRLVAGGLLSVASTAIIWSELIRFPAPHLSAVSLTVIHHPSNDSYQIGLGGQVIAAFWICYMCTCALSSIADVPVWNQRALVRRNTYAESACWYAGQIARLTVPLAYNFLTFLPSNIQKQTTFYAFLGKLINLTPLGTWFDYLFPIFILIPVCATLFNLYGRIKNIFGFGILEDEDERNQSGFGTGGWREGRDLIARDLNGPAGHSALGLLDTSSSSPSPRPSSDVTRPPRWASPSRPTQGSEGSLLRNATTRGARTVRQPLPLDPEPDEENFLTLFGRRVKNTFETLEPPRWMGGNSEPPERENSSSSGGGMSRPRWMGGGDQSSSASGGDGSNFFHRLFNNDHSSQGSGGGSDHGRIVL
ncbi:hypothetical protein H2198_010554 [Neophaeococcomyces mojaviensis]|uniref:Uncharacterized protein n=1 Tax=Neophaeococcomyces mojaviensis TaxID=3383035 RepID=A0ACC2ZRD2_9EURO|nr:hypothetical protein H2198_010554 [Knufia sp. JES_112]